MSHDGIEKAKIRGFAEDTSDPHASARKFMKQSGNPKQWGETVFRRKIAGKGYRKEQLYVVKMIPVFMECLLLSSEKEPTYEKIEQGAWISDTEYGTLHRVAGDGTIHGIFDKDRRFLRTENRTSESRYA